jgi:dTMP kinase
VYDEYEGMREKFGFKVVDASEEIHVQQAKVRQFIGEQIDLPAFRQPPCR